MNTTAAFVWPVGAPTGSRSAINGARRTLPARTNETEAAVLGTLAGRTLADSLDELRAIDRADPR